MYSPNKPGRPIRRIFELDQQTTGYLMRLAQSHRWAHMLAAGLAHSGDGVLWVAIGLASLAVASPHGRMVVLEIAAATVLTAAIVTVLKLVIRRQRPSPEGSRWSALPKYDRYAFPSGHSARAACVSLGVATAMPFLWPVLLLWTVSLSVARVAIGAHHVIDVIAGALVGMGGVMLTHRLWPTLMTLW